MSLFKKNESYYSFLSDEELVQVTDTIKSISHYDKTSAIEEKMNEQCNFTKFDYENIILPELIILGSFITNIDNMLRWKDEIEYIFNLFICIFLFILTIIIVSPKKRYLRFKIKKDCWEFESFYILNYYTKTYRSIRAYYFDFVNMDGDIVKQKVSKEQYLKWNQFKYVHSCYYDDNIIIYDGKKQ